MTGYLLFFVPRETWGLAPEELRVEVEAMKAWDRLWAHYGGAE